MLKSLTNLFKSDNAKWIFVLIVVCIIAYSLMNYSQGKGMVLDAMTTGEVMPNQAAGNEVFDQAKPSDLSNASVVPEGTEYQSVSTATPQDLLPGDSNSEFAKLNPTTTSQMPDLLSADSQIGVDTIGQTLRNANLQLRSDPPITKTNVGPWNNTTIERDISRQPFEIGCGDA